MPQACHILDLLGSLASGFLFMGMVIITSPSLYSQVLSTPSPPTELEETQTTSSVACGSRSEGNCWKSAGVPWGGRDTKEMRLAPGHCVADKRFCTKGMRGQSLLWRLSRTELCSEVAIYVSEARLLQKVDGKVPAAVYPGKQATVGLQASRPGQATVLPRVPVPKTPGLGFPSHPRRTRRAARQEGQDCVGEASLQHLSLPWDIDLESWPWRLGDGHPGQAVTQAGWVSRGAASTWG